MLAASSDAADAVEPRPQLLADLLDGGLHLDHADHLRGDVADHEVDALAAEPAHPFRIGIALRHVEETRDRHLRQDHVAGQRELQAC